MNSELANLMARVTALENERLVSACMHRYMHMCDDLNVDTDLQPLLDLFTSNAVWEGEGDYYRKKLGQHKGVAAIGDMFARYTRPPAHFKFNLHVLGNEVIHVAENTARGQWVLVQPSDFTSGLSHLNAAQINADFEYQNGQWRISHFRTRNLFSRAMTTPWQQGESVPVPPANTAKE